MTDDNSPQLGGQDHDNAPMISGRGTKIIVSARGAYVAGNLYALLDMLDTEQTRRFKQTVIRIAQPWVLRVMENFPELRERMPDFWDALPLVDQWLSQPNGGIEATITELLQRIWPDLYAHHGEKEEILPSLLAAVVHYTYHDRLRYDASHWVSVVISSAYEFLYPPSNRAYNEELWLRLDRRYLELAWALVQRRDTPLPPALDQESLHAHLTNLPEMHRQERLSALLYSMTPEQGEQFRHIVLTQALRDFEICLAFEPHREVLQPYVSLFHSWIETRHQPDDEWYNKAYVAFKTTPPRRATLRVFDEMINAFGVYSDDTVSNLLRHSNDGVSLSARAAVAGTDLEDVLGYHPIIYTADARMTRQHLDLAYAILTDQPIPPLGDPQ